MPHFDFTSRLPWFEMELRCIAHDLTPEQAEATLKEFNKQYPDAHKAVAHLLQPRAYAETITGRRRTPAPFPSSMRIGPKTRLR